MFLGGKELRYGAVYNGIQWNFITEMIQRRGGHRSVTIGNSMIHIGGQYCYGGECTPGEL